jgi:hypothetical protein
VRIEQSAAAAGLENVQVAPALARVRSLYEHRIQRYKRGVVAPSTISLPAQIQKSATKLWPFRRS